jgi:hypothetical protein
MFSYDVTTDTWTRLGADAPFRTDYGNWKNLVGCFVSTYGVGFYVQWDGSRSKIYLYKPPGSTTVSRKGAEGRSGPEIEAYPNPFNPAVTISVRATRPPRLALGEAGRAASTLTIYDPHGRIVQTASMAANSYTWNAAQTPSGVYLLKARIGNRVLQKKLFLQK